MKFYPLMALLGSTALLGAAELKPIGAWNMENIQNQTVKACIGPDGRIVNIGKNASVVPGRSGGSALHIGGGWTNEDRNHNGALVIPKFAPRHDQSFTIMFDFKLDGDEGNKNFRKFKTLVESADGERGPGFRVFIFYGALTFRTGDGKKDMQHVSASSATVRIPALRWARLAVVHNAEDKTATLYLDGAKVAHGPMNIKPSRQRNLVFGSYREGFANPATAAYDNIVLFDKALTPADVAADYLKTLKKDI